MQKEFIRSPLNYTGNKYRILPQISKKIPDKNGVFVDLFCGGATVGFNMDAKKIILIDSNPRIVNLLKMLANKEFDKIITAVETLIYKYNLSYSYKYSYSFYKEKGFVNGNNGLKTYNYKGFYALRTAYNDLKNKNTFKANMMLYTLMIYGFNNDIRFNSTGMFNLPVGKTDFNKNNYNKLKSFNERAKNINFEFICSDFRSKRVLDIVSNADFVYCDPPYLITTAVYNENDGWTEKDENDLLSLLYKLNSQGIKFGLSNIIKKSYAENTILINWIKQNKYKCFDIDHHYRSASYNKKNRNANEEEVYITNAN